MAHGRLPVSRGRHLDITTRHRSHLSVGTATIHLLLALCFDPQVEDPTRSRQTRGSVAAASAT